MNFSYQEPGTIFYGAQPVAGYCSYSQDSFKLMIDTNLEQTVLDWFLDYKQIVEYEIIERNELVYNIEFVIKVGNKKE